MQKPAMPPQRAAGRLTTWLTTIVASGALAQLRGKPRQSHLSLDEQFNEEQDRSLADSLGDNRPNPEDQCVGLELHGFFMRFLSELLPSLQQVIQRRCLDGLTIGEAARALEVPVATAKTRLCRHARS